MKISKDTFELLFASMVDALDTQDRNSGGDTGYDLTLLPALFSALDGDKEQVLRDLAIAIAPGTKWARDGGTDAVVQGR